MNGVSRKFAAFELIYLFAPNLGSRERHWFTPGTVIAVLLWLLISFGFRLYLHFFNSYSKTYGSLGALIVLMLWFYLTGAAILIGGRGRVCRPRDRRLCAGARAVPHSDRSF